MKLETFEQWKQKICSGVFDVLPAVAEKLGYRYSDIFDYICEHLDLDNNFDEIVSETCRKYYNNSIYEEYMNTHHADELKMRIALTIMHLVELNISKGVY